MYYAAYPMDYRVDHLRDMFNLPENIVPHAVLPIGWPKKPLEEKNRFDAIMVHKNRW